MPEGGERSASAAPMAVPEGPDAAPLEVARLSKSFGAVQAVCDVSFALSAGSLCCLIGPNGAGKSTLLHCVSGRLIPERGSVLLLGRDVTALAPHRRARLGLAVVFQSWRPLAALDVLSNAMLGAHAHTRSGFTAAILRLRSHRREELQIAQSAREALALVGLEHRALDRAGTLPFGQLRLLAIARALAQRPQVVLLDEPAAGLRAAEKERLVALLARLRGQGLTQLLVEHDMQFVGAVADRVLVLDHGELIANGTPDQVRADARVRTAYLGSGAHT